jgi:hypothetical protein
MKTRKKDIKLALTTVGLIGKIRKQLPPAGKPFVDKKRLSKLDLSLRKAKYKNKDI